MQNGLVLLYFIRMEKMIGSCPSQVLIIPDIDLVDRRHMDYVTIDIVASMVVVLVDLLW